MVLEGLAGNGTRRSGLENATSSIAPPTIRYSGSSSISEEVPH